jgi:diacylglycerol O-acyltransferase / wax synthase
LCGGSLRRFLKEIGKLPGQSLTAGIPVSLRAKDDHSSGPSVGFILGTLATNIADPLRRLEVIAASTRRAKTLMQGLPRHALDLFSTAVMAPYSLQILMGLEGRTRPVYNVPISNIPGPHEHLYLRGARLEAMYPVSVVTHGQALNITCYSYAGTLSFGFAGCRDTLPHMQRIAVYTGEVLKELEQAVFGKEAPPKVTRERKARATKRAARKKSAS